MRCKRLDWMVTLVLLTLGATAWVGWRSSVVATSSMAAVPPQTLAPASPSLLVAPGRVEPISEEVNIGIEIGGKIIAVLIDEGAHVQSGQTLALLENSDYKAQLVAAEARLRQTQAELQRVINGARREERRAAWAAVEQAEAIMRHAEVAMTRRQLLFQRGYIAREEADRAARDFQVAQARFAEVRAQHAFLTAEAREEDRARAQAAVALARAQIDEARARLDKTVIRSPLAGTVLRRYINPGESVFPESSRAVLFTVADMTTLRVRVEVDETDVGKLCTGQEAYVTAEAYGDKKFRGRVVRIGQMLGRKRLHTDAPAERVDTKVLETLVELEKGQILLPGLRVNAFIVVPQAVIASNDGSCTCPRCG